MGKFILKRCLSAIPVLTMCWLKLGRRDKAKEIIDALLGHGMSEEFVFSERIDSTDGYYVPWSPNGSAMGRAFTMLNKFYADQG